MKEKFVKWMLVDLAIGVIVVFYYALLWIFNTTCLIKLIVNVECPTCGMTRAMISLLKGDIKGYIDNNYLALPAFVVVYLSFHLKDKGKKIVSIFAIVLAVAIFLRYIIKFF